MTNTKIPILRFPEFTDNWEEKKLGEIADIIGGFAFKSNKMKSQKSQYQIIKMTNVYLNELQLDRNPAYLEKINNQESKYLLRKNDVVLTLTGTTGKTDFGYSTLILEDNKYLLNQRLLTVREKRDISNSIFLSFVLKGAIFLNNFFNEAKGGTGNQTNVSIEDVKNIISSFPTLPEQTKIANFLTAVDKTLNLLKEKKSLLETYKKGIMQQIFNQELRFKKDDGNDFEDWEYAPLSDYLYEPKERNYDMIYSKENVLSVSGEYGIVNQIEHLGRSFAGVSVANYHVVRNNDIVYTKSPLKANPYGIIKVNKGDAGIVSTLYAVYGCNDNLQGTFLNYYFQLDDNLNKYLRPLVRKGAKNDMKVNNTHVLSGYIWFPSLEEQQKIANFLSAIDDKIANCQQSIINHQLYKKGLLQQLFC